MLVIAHHNISRPEEFWTKAKDLAQNLPGSLKLHGVYPSKDLMTGTCLWEADSTEEVQQFLDKEAGKLSKNFCYEVNVKDSIGLPSIKMEPAKAN